MPDPADRRRVLVEATEKAYEAAMELMVAPMGELTKPMATRYSDEQLELFIEFTREGREIQERHADWLRRGWPSGAPGRPDAGPGSRH